MYDVIIHEPAVATPNAIILTPFRGPLLIYLRFLVLQIFKDYHNH